MILWFRICDSDCVYICGELWASIDNFKNTVYGIVNIHKRRVRISLDELKTYTSI